MRCLKRMGLQIIHTLARQRSRWLSSGTRMPGKASLHSMHAALLCWFSSCVVILLLPAIKSCPLCHRFVSHLLHERLAQNLDPENVEVTAAHISGAIMNALRSPKGLGGLGSYWAQHTNNFFTRFLAGRTRYSGVSPCAGVLLHLLH